MQTADLEALLLGLVKNGNDSENFLGLITERANSQWKTDYSVIVMASHLEGLVDKGLLEGNTVKPDTGRARRHYKITGKGEKILSEAVFSRVLIGPQPVFA